VIVAAIPLRRFNAWIASKSWSWYSANSSLILMLAGRVSRFEEDMKRMYQDKLTPCQVGDIAW